MATQFKQVADNATSFTATNYSSTGVTATALNTGDGAKFPTPGTGFILTIWTGNDPGADSNMEKVLVTGKSGDSLIHAATTKTHTSPTNVGLLNVASNVADLQVAVNAAETTIATLPNLANDLGGTAVSPTVVSTHLSAPLPINQGGTGSVTQTFVDLTSAQTVTGVKNFQNGYKLTDVNSNVWVVKPSDKGTLNVAKVNPRVFTPTTSAYALNDNFNGTNGTAISSHQADNSFGDWSQTAATSFYIQGNDLKSNRNTDADMAIIETGVSDNCTITANVIPYASGINQSYAGIVFRYQDASNYWYAFADVLNSNVQIRQVLGGVDTRYIRYSTNTPTNGVPIELRVDLFGPNITLFMNGTEIVTYVSTSLQSATKFGVRYGKSNSPAQGATWSNIAVTPYKGVKINWPVYTKYSGNPIVPLGASGAWDSTDINDPVVVWDSDTQRFVVVYTGYYNNGSDSKIQNLGLAYGNPLNLVGGWKKEPTNPVMTQISTESYYNFNGGVCRKGSAWYMAYGVANGASPASAIALATSPDLKTWTRQGTILSPTIGSWDTNGIFDASIRLREDGTTLEIWYCGKNSSNARSFGYATSTDNGATWTKYSGNPIFTYPQWANSQTTLGEPEVFVPPGKEGQEMMLTFDTAYTETSGNRFISQAVTVDGGATWHYRVAASSAGTGWEAAQNFDSFSFLVGDTLYLFYGGGATAGASLNLSIQIGLATAYWPYQSFLAA